MGAAGRVPSGLSGQREISNLTIDGRHLEVANIIDNWLASDNHYFELRSNNDATHIVQTDSIRILNFGHLRNRRL